MSRYLALFSRGVLINLLFAAILYFTITDDEMTGVPKKRGWDRFVTLFYYGVTVFTTTGFGDISVQSTRLKLFVSLYMLLVYSSILSVIFF
jgi:hypothetical protein